MRDPHIRQRAYTFVQKVKADGRWISFRDAECVVLAADYLRRQGVRGPITPEQVGTLDPRGQDAAKLFCRLTAELGSKHHAERCKNILNQLALAKRITYDFSQRSVGSAAPDPICGWYPRSHGGVFTQKDWKQKPGP